MCCLVQVFSGHSMTLCLQGMVWHTYYPRAPGLRVNFVKLGVWVFIVMGLMSILAVRLHYTLVCMFVIVVKSWFISLICILYISLSQDVVLAVYFSITVWSAYHRIAHDIAVGHHFSMIWFIDHGIRHSSCLLC